MADIPGVSILGNVALLNAAAGTITPDIYVGIPTLANPLVPVVQGNFGAGPLGGGLGVISSEPDVALAGDLWKMYGQELFEKIIVTPRSYAAGFVVSAISFNVDVWNTHVSALELLTAIVIDGSGGLVIANPFGFPTPLGPSQALDFTATLPTDGDATVDNTATFVFSGGDLGTDLHVTGIRITLFTLDPDWGKDIKEKTAYLSVIMRSYGDKEQRYAVRKNPRTRLKFTPMGATQRDTNALEALLWGWQSRIYGVPFWPDAQQISAPITAGDTVINIPTTTNMKFKVGGLCMVWRDVMTAEALSVAAIGPTSVTLSAPVSASYANDGMTFCVPVLQGRMAPQVEVERLSSQHGQLETDFECEVV
jgi:hypothetical protein